MGWTLTNYEDGRKAETPADYADAATNDGWTWNNGTDEEAWQFQPSSKPAYAMDVLEKCAVKRTEEWNEYRPDATLVIHAPRKEWNMKWLVASDAEHTVIAEADTLPLAICLFAQKLYGN